METEDKQYLSRIPGLSVDEEVESNYGPNLPVTGYNASPERSLELAGFKSEEPPHLSTLLILVGILSCPWTVVKLPNMIFVFKLSLS